MDVEPPNDLILGNSEVARFDAARLARYSDWFVTARSRPGPDRPRHGGDLRPRLAVRVQRVHGGDPIVRFPAPPEVFHETPTGASSGSVATAAAICSSVRSARAGPGWAAPPCGARPGARRGVTVALLPDGRRSPEIVELFTRRARNPVRDTTVSWAYDEARSRVRVHFGYGLEVAKDAPAATLFALYPHQSTAFVEGSASPELGSCTTVRGRMSLPRRRGVRRRVPVPGRPAGVAGAAGGRRPRRCAGSCGATRPPHPARDTYWAGKELGRLATLHGLARQLGLEAETDALETRLRAGLESWFERASIPPTRRRAARSSTTSGGGRWSAIRPATARRRPSTIITSTTAISCVPRRSSACAIGRGSDPTATARSSICSRGDIASGRRGDPAFPFFRVFDPYAGHSWAAGDAVAGDGNNQESSSEAMAAWTAFVLLGELRGDRTLRDLGIVPLRERARGDRGLLVRRRREELPAVLSGRGRPDDLGRQGRLRDVLLG